MPAGDLSKLDVENVLKTHYEKLDTLVHTTTFKSARSIIENGFKPKLVTSKSVITPGLNLLSREDTNPPNPRPRHPISDLEVLWYSPSSLSKSTDPDNQIDRHGNVAFSMKTLHFKNCMHFRCGVNIYFIEVIEYYKQSACRFLVTSKFYPNLKSYNPELPYGPFYRDEKSGDVYYLKHIKRINPNVKGVLKRNVLEVMKDIGDNSGVVSWHYKNHYINVSSCRNPHYELKEEIIEGPMSYKQYLQNTLKIALHLSLKRFSSPCSVGGMKILIDLVLEEQLREELNGIHLEATKNLKSKINNGDLESFIKSFSSSRSFMSPNDISYSYFDFLCSIPNQLHAGLLDTLWKIITNKTIELTQ